MKFEKRKIKVGMLLVAISIFSFLSVYFYTGSSGQGSNVVAQAEQTYLLENPVFALSAINETTFLEEEAGMSIYINVGHPLDLSDAKPVYRTIEKETSYYIIGSVGVDSLPETEDIHCFVHKDGWIVAYYLKSENISKIIDWNYWSGSTLTGNKLQAGFTKMGNMLEVDVTNAKYYHFQYPYAKKCMMIIKTQVGDGLDSFNIKIPQNFSVYERSWSHYSEYISGSCSHFAIDGNTIDSICYLNIEWTNYGGLTAAQLSKNEFHTVSISGRYSGKLYGTCIILAYEEP